MEEDQVKELDALLQKRVAEANKKREKTPMVTFEEFQKLDIRTGKVLSAEPVPKSNKLLKLQVDIGGETRQIVAGMQQFYKPDELTGRDVVVVTNLAPGKNIRCREQWHDPCCRRFGITAHPLKTCRTRIENPVNAGFLLPF